MVRGHHDVEWVIEEVHLLEPRVVLDPGVACGETTTARSMRSATRRSKHREGLASMMWTLTSGWVLRRCAASGASRFAEAVENPPIPKWEGAWSPAVNDEARISSHTEISRSERLTRYLPVAVSRRPRPSLVRSVIPSEFWRSRSCADTAEGEYPVSSAVAAIVPEAAKVRSVMRRGSIMLTLCTFPACCSSESRAFPAVFGCSIVTAATRRDRAMGVPGGRRQR